MLFELLLIFVRLSFLNWQLILVLPCYDLVTSNNGSMLVSRALNVFNFK